MSGATLRKPRLVAKRIVLVATVCPTCGTLRATWTSRTTQSVTISLSATKQTTKKLVTLFTLSLWLLRRPIEETEDAPV